MVGFRPRAIFLKSLVRGVQGKETSRFRFQFSLSFKVGVVGHRLLEVRCRKSPCMLLIKSCLYVALVTLSCLGIAQA